MAVAEELERVYLLVKAGAQLDRELLPADGHMVEGLADRLRQEALEAHGDLEGSRIGVGARRELRGGEELLHRHDLNELHAGVADGEPIVDHRLPLAVGDLTLHEKERLVLRQGAGKAQNRGLPALEGHEELVSEPLHEGVQIPEQVDVGPALVLGAGTANGGLYEIAVGG